MSALLDMRCVQVAVHFGRHMSYLPPKSIRDLERRCRIRDLEQARGRRLEAFLEVVQRCCGAEPVTSNGTENELLLPLLSKHRTLITGSRIRCCPFSDEECAQVEQYVHRGGNLLLMSNHDPYAKRDSRLAERFGVSLAGDYRGGGPPWIAIDGDDLGTHCITNNLSGGIVFNTSCRIHCTNPNASVLATLPGEAGQANGSAIAIDRPAGSSSGRIVVLADSGFIGNDDTRFPGPGLIGQGANRQFIKNCVYWLHGEEVPP